MVYEVHYGQTTDLSTQQAMLTSALLDLWIQVTQTTIHYVKVNNMELSSECHFRNTIYSKSVLMIIIYTLLYNVFIHRDWSPLQCSERRMRFSGLRLQQSPMALGYSIHS